MLDTSVRFPTHEVNQFNSRLPLRGQAERPSDAAVALFASHADEPQADTPAFQPVLTTLAEIGGGKTETCDDCRLQYTSSCASPFRGVRCSFFEGKSEVGNG